MVSINQLKKAQITNQFKVTGYHFIKQTLGNPKQQPREIVFVKVTTVIFSVITPLMHVHEGNATIETYLKIMCSSKALALNT